MLEFIEKYRADFAKKAEEEFEKYQESGMARYEKSANRYKDLEEICEMAQKNKEFLIQDTEKRRRNIDSFVSRLEDKTYSFAEVKELIFEIKYM
jgi:hypothetical protein